MSEYICTNKFDTNECPNIFVKEKLTRTNVRIYIHDQYIRIFEYSNIFVTLWFRASETCRTWFVIHLVEFISCDTDRHKSFQLTVQAVLLHSTACNINDFRIFPCEHHWKSVDYFILAAAGHQIQAWRKLCMWWKVLFTRVFFIFCILCETKI